ncbi:MAG: FAD-binding protein [Lewinellaceae bacterium]|nr:FAD-binding protein [Lewinellaceae bacterium]
MLNHLFLRDLQLNLRGDVLADKTSLGLYSTDASVYQIQPVAVVMPQDEADVLTAIRIAGNHQVSILPRGGGTSLAGQTVGHSMVLDFSRYMNRILEVNEQERWARVQPGLVRDELNAALEPLGLHFAPDPATSSRANIGGMIGNNSSGTKSILYGKTVDHVLELKVALPDGTLLHLKNESPEGYQKKEEQQDREGEIYRQFRKVIQSNETEILARFPKVMRRVQGYNLDEFAAQENWNLSKLLCGSEGTLATILEAKINLEPLPRFKAVCVVHFAELLEAIRAVAPMLPFQPAAVEILDRSIVELSRKNLTTQRHCHFIEGHPAAIQIVEFYGETAEDVLERPRQMMAKLKGLGLGYAYPLFPQGPEYEDVWIIRKKGLGLMLGMKGDKKPLPFIEDAGIPKDVLPEYIRRVLAICKKHQTQAAMYAHASVGVIHVRPILDLRQAADIERFKHISEETFELVKEYGGSWSGEHGDGLARSFYLRRYFGDQVYEALRQVKQLFDPQNRMNPGKIIDAPPIDRNLRYGAAYRDNPVETVFQFREDSSFENAVHTCTGVGECRKMLGGTMCPSFKATRNEEHSTRGRANALRLAMSGQLSTAGLSDKRLLETLDLCLSCKACKSECPSNVDMAKLKSEVWQKKFEANGITWRDRFIRDSAKMAAGFSGPLAPFVNRLQKTAIFRAFLDKAIGIEQKRVLPDYARAPFCRWFEKNRRPPAPAGKRVVLFADTFLNFHEPNIGISATRLLEACGYEVLLANVGCCQRPRISHGFLQDAKRDGLQTALGLDAYLRQGLKVVVCEPSCASALNDDLPDLIEDETLARRLQAGVLMIDVFLHQEQEAGRLEYALEPLAESTFLHGHCHQKALYGTKSMMALLSGNGGQVQEIPSGCCGMAGAFGYEKEHYGISEKIGEQVLFPAVLQMNEGAALIACGTSCRQQIRHFTGKRAVHWVEAVRVRPQIGNSF